jgi:hypothetical protein
VNNDDDEDLGDLEESLDDEYHNYFEDIELTINLDGDEDNITFYVEIDYDEYSDEWDALTNSEIKEFMKDIYSDIEDEFEDADIKGRVYDTDSDEYLGTYTDDDGYEED